MNFPTVAALDGEFRKRLEHLGMGYDKEVEMTRIAHEMGLFTMCYAYKPEEAEQMAKANCDIIIAHLGLTTGGELGSKRAPTLQDGAVMVQEIIDAAKKIKNNVIPLAHGGPISAPKDTEYIYEHTSVLGFLGASSIERIPWKLLSGKPQKPLNPLR